MVYPPHAHFNSNNYVFLIHGSTSIPMMFSSFSADFIRNSPKRPLEKTGLEAAQLFAAQNIPGGAQGTKALLQVRKNNDDLVLRFPFI